MVKIARCTINLLKYVIHLEYHDSISPSVFMVLGFEYIVLITSITKSNIHINNNNANNGNNKEFLMEGIVLSMQHELQLEEDLNHENETENEEEELHWGI